MARISEAELERLKTEVSLQRLVEAKGVRLVVLPQRREHAATTISKPRIRSSAA